MESPAASGGWCNEVEEVTHMEASVGAVENLLGYRFKQRKLLEEALTHSSCVDSTSYQRLEFVGDAALGLAFSNFVYLNYPGLDPGKLSLLRAANISTEKLARVAVRHRLYKYLCHKVTSLDEKVYASINISKFSIVSMFLSFFGWIIFVAA